MGPLAGVRVLEFEAIGPGPFAGMLLADLGADVLVVDRPADSDLGLKRERWFDVMMRGKRSVTLDLKQKDAAETALQLISKADALIEGFRPGVMERLGLGPKAALARNPKLVYGRMTGWGQDGPLAARAGHDINYIALAGVLHAFGRRGEAPVPPLNLVGDFGGGGMLLALGIACALLEAGPLGKGQVVDAAMVEGASLLAAMFSGFLAAKSWSEERGVNILDTGAPWYDVYETRTASTSRSAPSRRSSMRIWLPPESSERQSAGQYDRAAGPSCGKSSESLQVKTREEWNRVFEGSDACFAPVLTFSESRDHPHNAAAKLRRCRGGSPARPGARLSRTPGAVRRAPPERGEGGLAALADWGFSTSEVERLRSRGLGHK
jgi:alpha-methylacyl-CoA racemase